MSSELLWCDAVNGPQNAAHASPFAMYELAKNTLPAAVNPLLSLHASPTKVLYSFALSVTDAPACMMQLSHITPSDMRMLASGVLFSVDSTSRAAPEAVADLYVRSNAGAMVPIGSLGTISREIGPRTVSCYNKFLAAGITVMPKPGVASSDVMVQIVDALKRTLPEGYGYRKPVG